MAAARSRKSPRIAERPPSSQGSERNERSQRLLLDTHVWLWWQAGDSRLGGSTRSAIGEAGEVFFSMASAWEIAIKASLGKVTLPRSADIAAELAIDGFVPLGIEFEHARLLASIPGHHRDPFDRMLIAQAIAEDLTIVSADTWVSRYDVRRLEAGR
ncbi:MAG TPA: type II toxin-antitoxin system VapC family toxin [Gemmatimonadaceae bacterium]|jgi:PIN domain nuclease of toxin-antitoxin system|nr:type II toxin-antitoxin system VapC family toxin [Gemmatimonadaceae bacterium]